MREHKKKRENLQIVKFGVCEGHEKGYGKMIVWEI